MLPLLSGWSRASYKLPLKDKLASVDNSLSKLLNNNFSIFIATQIRLRFSFACTREFVVAFGVLLLQERFVKRVPARQFMLFEQCPELPEIQITDINDLRWLRAVGKGSVYLHAKTVLTL
jgi:hypothetical protein